MSVRSHDWHSEDAPRNLEQGAFVLPTKDSVHFRVWAPVAEIVQVVLERQNRTVDLLPDGRGYFSADAAGGGAGDRYRYQLDGGAPMADPASRFQPEGPGRSFAGCRYGSFEWSDAKWRGITLPGQVLYELHIGSFTAEGTYPAAEKLLPELKRLGITAIEMMPIADFTGSFGWGYDGVLLYAPYEKYGSPKELQSFINAAHGLGIGVVLDVVYNHIGPTGNVLPEFSPYYFSKTEKTDWGSAINFDGERSDAVRAYFRENAVYWIKAYHFDGLRVDATQDIHDKSQPHILAEMVTAARKAAGQRDIIVIGENEPQQSFYVRPQSKGGYGFDGLWNDDFHHSAIVALTGQCDAYDSDQQREAAGIYFGIEVRLPVSGPVL